MTKLLNPKLVLPILFACSSLIMIVSSFYYGLFFNEHLLMWGIPVTCLSILTLIYTWYMKKFSYIALLPYLIPVMYMVSIVGAESPQSSIQQTLYWSAFASFFYILFITKESNLVKKFMPHVLYLFFVIIAIFPYLVKWGLFEYNQAFWGERMASVFQYSNTFGALMVLSWLFGLIQLLRTDLKWQFIVLLALPLPIFIADLLQSLSRGSFVVLPLTWFFALLFLSTTNQVKYITISIISVLSGFLLYLQMSESILVDILSISLISLIMGLLILYVLKFLHKQQISDSLRKPWFIPVGLFTIGIGLVLDVVNKGVIFNTLPSTLQERIASINLSTDSVQARFRFFEQALEMSKDAPLFGFGGGGWRILFTKYQEEPFWTNEIHNFYLELLLDIGWIGLAVTLSILTVIVYKIIANYSKESNSNQKYLTLSAVTGLLILLLHGFIDFDFSYGTVVFVFYWLLVLGLPSINSTKVKGSLLKGAHILVLVGIGLTLFFSYQFYSAKSVVADMKDKSVSLNEAEKQIMKAKGKNPWEPQYYLQLADVYKKAYNNNSNEQVKVRINSLLQEASKLEPENPSLHYDIGKMYASLGNRKKAIEMFNTSVSNDRFSSEYTYFYIVQNVLYAENLMQEAKYSEADEHLHVAIERYKKFNSYIKEYENKEIPDERDLVFDKRLILLVGEAYFLLKEYDRSLEVLKDISFKSGEQQEYIRYQAIKKMIAKTRKNDKLLQEIKHNTQNQKLLQNYISYFNDLIDEK